MMRMKIIIIVLAEKCVIRQLIQVFLYLERLFWPVNVVKFIESHLKE